MNDKKYISEEGYQKLQLELNELKINTRQEIAKRIEEAKKLGDLSENAEYIEAKESQELNEKKIAELEDFFRNAEVISKHREKGIVQVGSSIEVKSGPKTMHFVIVGSEEADPALGKISYISPIGSAFLNKKEGEKVEVSTPNGKIKYEIVGIQ